MCIRDRAAAHAPLGVHPGHAVYHLDGPVGAHGHAVAQAKTAVSTRSGPAKEEPGGGTDLQTPVLRFALHGLAVPTAADDGPFGPDLAAGPVQHGADLAGGGDAAGDAEVGGGLLLHQGTGVVVAALVAAGAAVGAGETGTGLLNPLVDVYKRQGSIWGMRMVYSFFISLVNRRRPVLS